MNYKKIIIFLFIVLLLVVNVLMLWQNKKLSESSVAESEKRLVYEYIAKDEICNIGTVLNTDSLPTGRHFILRYDVTACMVCVTKAEALLENVFGREFLAKELCIIGVEGIENPFGNIFPISNQEQLSPMDYIYTPYFCVINDNGDILYSLSMIPENFDYNREILIKLKKALDKS